MKYIAFASLCATMLAAPVFAQTSQPIPAATEAPSLWSGEMEFGISPRVGKVLPKNADDDILDESEGEASIAIKRDKAFFNNHAAQVKAGVTLSPQVFDDGDAESGYYAEVTFGDSYIPLSRLIARTAGEKADAVTDAVRPYLRYRFTSAYSNSFDSWLRDEHQATAGIRYRDVRTILCTSELAAARDVGACSNTRGVYLEFRAELNKSWSTDASKRRFFPSLRGDIYSRPFLNGIRAFARAQGEASFYSDVRITNGDHREDWRLRLTGGLDLSGLLTRLGPDISFELAGQYQRRWSNDPGSRHERGYFVPSFSITTGF